MVNEVKQELLCVTHFVLRVVLLSFSFVAEIDALLWIPSSK